MHLPELIQQQIRSALQDLTETPDEFAGMIRPTGDPKFGDYQCNAAMPLAKRLGGGNPRDLAAQILDRLSVSDFCDPPTIAGPGFINLRIKDDWIAQRLVDMIDDPRCVPYLKMASQFPEHCTQTRARLALKKFKTEFSTQITG